MSKVDSEYMIFNNYLENRRVDYNASVWWFGADLTHFDPSLAWPQLTTYSNLSHLQWVAQSCLARGNLADPEIVRPTVL